MKIDTLLFDLGNVLVEWNPAYLYEKIFTNGEQLQYFLENICTGEWHTQQDAGRDIQEATEALVQQHPEWEPQIRAFYSRWKEMFRGAIEGSVEILRELKEKGYKLYALSNWNADLFKQTEADFPFLHLFDGIILSGEVKMVKPNIEIYTLLLHQFSIKPEQALFIDDRKDNIKAAQELGIRSILFQSPEGLREALTKLDIL